MAPNDNSNRSDQTSVETTAALPPDDLRVWAITSPRRASAPCAVVAVSHREQPVEEVAVTPQGETKVFGGSLFATGPLFLEP